MRRFGISFVAAAGLVLAFLAAMPLELRAARPTRAKPAKGMFLVASARMMDPNFARTVILLTRYGPDGAMGIVVNRPTNVSIAHAVPDLSGFSRSNEGIYFGGPVTPNGLFLLVKMKGKPEAQQVLDDVYVGRSRALLKDLIDKTDAVFRVYTGYAGWAPGQLDMELARGDWLVKPADSGSVFFEDEQLWRNLLPPDPSWSAELRSNHH